MSQRCRCKDQKPPFDMDEARRVVAALGPMPRETLSAMADYGMSDAEISRYFRISTCTVAALRQHFEKRATI